MAIQKTEAFILKTHPFRTSSLVVTTFSRSFGKIKGLAKGVRREGVVRPSTFEPFTLVEIVFYEKIRSELHLFSEVSILESHEGLRRDLSALASAYYCVELVDQVTEPHDPHEAIFELLGFVLGNLPSFPPVLLTRFFEIRLLQEVGLLPHLSGCLACGERKPEKAFFSVRQGGIFCARCRTRAPEARAMRGEVLELMRRFTEGTPPARSCALPLLTEMGEFMERFLGEKLGSRLKTRRFLHQVSALRIKSETVPHN